MSATTPQPTPSDANPAKREQTLFADDLVLRRMRSEDIASGVMPIESVSFGKHHWSEDSFHNEMNNQIGRYYVLVKSNPDTQNTNPTGVLGYCGVWHIVDEGHVTTVAVNPELRGNALGEVQVVHMMMVARRFNLRYVTLEVRVTNYGAQNLYYKYGFNSVGTRPKYYQDNQEDALIMTTPDIQSPEFTTLFESLKDKLSQRLKGLPAGLGD